MNFTDKMFGDHLQYLTTALDAVAARQDVLVNNIANAGTSDFVPQTVAFEDQFRQILAEKFGDDSLNVALETSEPEHIQASQASISSFSPVISNSNGPVNLQQEMVKLAKNQILFNAVSDATVAPFLGNKFVIENFGR